MAEELDDWTTPEADDWITHKAEPNTQPAALPESTFSRLNPFNPQMIERDKASLDADKGGDLARETVKNIPSSALEFGKNVVQPFIHPVETAESLKNLGHGVLQKTGLVSGNENEPYADAVGKFLVDRYGSMDAVKNTLVHDPVGIAADISMLLSGGGMAAARAPGIVGEVGRAASVVGRAVDPLSVVGAVAAPIAKGAAIAGAEVAGGLGTHTGGQALRTAAEAGYEGGEAARALREQMRGTAPMEEVVSDARGALNQIRQERGDAYRAGMANIGKDQTVLDFDKIDDALVGITKVGTYKGQVIQPKTQAIRQEIGQTIAEWKNLPPREYHTPEGLDALKQKIGDIRDHTEYGTPARKVADQAYHAIRHTIVAQAPEYSKVMKGYELASQQLGELEKALSLGQKASVDTSLRKLQSVLRNNVSSNYGNRKTLAAFLATHGAPELMEKLAGQSLSAWLPRGLGKLQAGLQSSLLGFLVPGGLVHAAAMLPAMSPRLMGELAYLGGKTAAGAEKTLPAIKAAVPPSFQLGRADDEAIP